MGNPDKNTVSSGAKSSRFTQPVLNKQIIQQVVSDANIESQLSGLVDLKLTDYANEQIQPQPMTKASKNSKSELSKTTEKQPLLQTQIRSAQRKAEALSLKDDNQKLNLNYATSQTQP